MANGMYKPGILFLAIAVLLSCSRQSREEISGSGILEATEILVSSPLAGRLIFVAADEGDAVKTSTVLALVDTEKIAIQYNQLEAALLELQFNLQNSQRGVQLTKEGLQNTEKKFGRIETLLREKSATQQQYDDGELAWRTARVQFENALASHRALLAKQSQLQAQKDLLRTQLKDARLVAPIDGVVLQKFLQQDEWVKPGSPVFNLANLKKMWIRIYVGEADLASLQLGMPAQLNITSRPAQPFVGTVTWISPKAEFTPKNVQTKEARADLVYAIKIEVENPDGILKIGMPADVIIRLSEFSIKHE